MALTPRRRDTRTRPTPWKNPPRRTGDFAIIDIDGVIASMEKYEHLIKTERSRDRDWHTFHRSYGFAKPIRSGRKLIESLQAVNVGIAYSTTRPEQFARATWNWIDRNNFPLGPVMFRHFIKDGPRPENEVKVRHWWSWYDNYDADHRLVAWFDDDQSATNELRKYGCPAWIPKEFHKKVRAAGGTDDAVIKVLRDGPLDLDLLGEREETSRGPWQEKEDQWQEKQKAWFKKHQAALKDRNRRQ
ncbi:MULTISPECIES: hypothetical protein [Rhodococcus]|uniref:hypothetical protein n=1 Tax=Rhodococcus TaxID=1827 RepID=UPI00110E1DB4|nr:MULTISPECIES: hypothetical protein [Rhodococcus]MCF8786077.1 hypothetical protein [Rhodococcus ruber]